MDEPSLIGPIPWPSPDDNLFEDCIVTRTMGEPYRDGEQIKVRLDFTCTHTLSDEHIRWFRAGSALNLIRERFADDRL